MGGRSRKTENRDLIRRLNLDGARIAQRFDLQYRTIEAERANVKRRYGICYEDGTIRIRLRHVTTGEPLKYSSLVDTLCHELAHLRHFDHSPRFHLFYKRLLTWARSEGIYRPGSAGLDAPALLPRLAPRPKRPPTPWERPPARTGPAFDSELLRRRLQQLPLAAAALAQRALRPTPASSSPARRNEAPAAASAPRSSGGGQRPVQLSLFG